MTSSVRRQPDGINIDFINIDASMSRSHDGPMSTLIGASEAAATLGVTKPTLYAYVSRGLVTRQVAVDGRTSLYDRAEVEALSHRTRRGPVTARPSIDVQIATGITRLHDDSPTYRGRRVLDLVDTHSFEEVADLLMTGEATGNPTEWRVDPAALDRARRIVDSAAPVDPLTALGLAARSLEVRADDDTVAV